MLENEAYGTNEMRERMEMTSNTAYQTVHQSQSQHPPESNKTDNEITYDSITEL